jgi:hypothetical protein
MKPAMNSDDIFQRVQTAYDLKLLRERVNVIIAGIGGAAGFAEDLVRAGVGRIVLIDPDTVSASNLATQQAYTMSDIGRPKVDCLADRLRSINPSVEVYVCQKRLEDIDKGEFDIFILQRTRCPPLAGVFRQPLLCGFTDSFSAQARINTLSLQEGIPSLCAQMYREGRVAEITFAYPGVTSACHRCMLSPRYKAYLEEGYQNTVTSDGSPVFATTRLNSLVGQIAMALLHHGTSHPRWGDMLTRIGNRTLVQLRLHPDTSLKVFDRVFGGADTERVFFDEAIWLPQEPDPNCPECKGTGDLREAKWRFTDTRHMPDPHRKQEQQDE